MNRDDDDFRKPSGEAEIHELGEARAAKFLRDLEAGRYPALLNGGARAEQLVADLEDGGMPLLDVLFFMAYSAAAEVFRREDVATAEECVRKTFDLILKDLLRNGPHHHDEAY